MKNNERLVHFYDLQMKSSTGYGGVKSPSCADIDDVLQACVKTLSKGHVVKQRGDILIEVEDCVYDSTLGTYQLLINKADKTIGDVTFKDFNGRGRRKGNKTRDEGIEASSHVILKPNQDRRSALVLITLGAGVSHHTVSQIFRVIVALLKKGAKHEHLFAFNDPSNTLDASGRPLQYRVRYAFECVGHKDRKLDQALKNGRFLSMDLISKGVEVFDTHGNLHIDERTVSISATNPLVVTAAVVINSVMAFVKNPKADPVDTVRIRYKNDAGKPTSHSFQPNEMEHAFTRKEIVLLNAEVEQQQSRLSPVIIAAMNELL